MAIKINYAGQQMSVAQGIEQAKELINKKQFVEAEALARIVLKRAPKSHVCKQILGIALAEQNDPGKKTAVFLANPKLK
jgi:Flp pilus assembly protein TadD